jgi:hypothetical protein
MSKESKTLEKYRNKSSRGDIRNILDKSKSKLGGKVEFESG